MFSRAAIGLRLGAALLALAMHLGSGLKIQETGAAPDVDVDDGVALGATASYRRRPIPLADNEGVPKEKCWDQMRPGKPTIAYLSRGIPYKTLWERTFLHELLRDVGEVLICDLSGNEQNVLEVLRRSGDDPVGFIVAGYPQQMQLTSLAEYIAKSEKKPRVLFHFSDETGKYDPNKIYPKIMPHDGLVLRQYQFWKSLPNTPPTRIMPLGYNMHLNFSGDSCAAAQQNAKFGPDKRKYNWAFVGGMHSTPWGNRADMVSELLGGRSFTEKDQLDSKEAFVGQRKGLELFEVYRDSIFAPNLPGSKNNECFRVYESVIAGAIPVVVGSENDIARFYGYHADASWKDGKPPFVFASSWTNARSQMQDLMKSPRKLTALYNQLAPWYCSWMTSIQHELRQALTK